MNVKVILAIILIIVAVSAWIFALGRKPEYKRYQDEEARLELEVEASVFLGSEEQFLYLI